MSGAATRAIELNALFELEDMMPDINKPFADEDVEGLEGIGLNVRAAMKAYVNDDSVKNSYIRQLRGKLAAGHRDLTDKQVRAALNIMRERTLGIKSDPKHDATIDPNFDHACRCRDCGEGFENVAVMVKHRVEDHDYEPPWGSEEQAMVDPVEVLGEAPQTELDVSSLPDGYYAVPLPNSYDSSGYTFLRVKRLKRNKNFRNRRYATGKVLTGAEFVPAGTVEVAEMSGDTKRLAGEQRGMQVPGEFYRGEFEQHLVVILSDPQVFAKMFAQQIGRCGRCGKTLTDDISRSDCFGPDCIDLVNDHFFSEWSGKYVDAAKTTCPYVECKQKDGKPVEGKKDYYECSNGHQWPFKLRGKAAEALASD